VFCFPLVYDSSSIEKGKGFYEVPLTVQFIAIDVSGHQVMVTDTSQNIELGKGKDISETLKVRYDPGNPADFDVTKQSVKVHLTDHVLSSVCVQHLTIMNADLWLVEANQFI
jgi:hypothetical protein